MSPTPKQARTYRKKHKPSDHTRNDRAFRVVASWNHSPDEPQYAHTSDRAKARRIIRQWTEQGAYVIWYERAGFEWRTVREYDGPALLAERRAAEQIEADRDRLARLMVRPPVARDATGRTTARHTAGGKRP